MTNRTPPDDDDSMLSRFNFDVRGTFDRIGETAAAELAELEKVATRPAPTVSEQGASDDVRPLMTLGRSADDSDSSTSGRPLLGGGSDVAQLERRLAVLEDAVERQRNVAAEWLERLVHEINQRLPTIVDGVVENAQRPTVQRMRTTDAAIERLRGEIADLDARVGRLFEVR